MLPFQLLDGGELLARYFFVLARWVWAADRDFADTVANTPSRSRQEVAARFWSGKTFWEESTCSG